MKTLRSKAQRPWGWFRALPIGAQWMLGYFLCPYLLVIALVAIGWRRTVVGIGREYLALPRWGKVIVTVIALFIALDLIASGLSPNSG